MNQFLSNLIRSVHSTDHLNIEILIHSVADGAPQRQSLTLAAQALKLNVMSAALNAKHEHSTSEDKAAIEKILDLCENLKPELEKLKNNIKTDKYSDVQASHLIHQFLTQQFDPIIERIIIRYNLERTEIDEKTQQSFENFIAEVIKCPPHLFAISQQAFRGLVVNDSPADIAQRQLFTWSQNTTPQEEELLETWQIAARLDSQTHSDRAVQTAQQNITFSQPIDTTAPLQVKTQYLPLTIEEENLFSSTLPNLTQDGVAIPQWFKDLFIVPGVLAITENMQSVHDTFTTIDSCIKGVIPGQAAAELKKLLEEEQNLAQLKIVCPEIRAILMLMDKALVCITNDDLRAEFHHTKIHEVLDTLVTILRLAGEMYFNQNSLINPCVNFFENQRQLLNNKKQRALDLAKIEVLLQAVEKKSAKFKQISDEVATQEAIAAMDSEFIGSTAAANAASKARQLRASTTQEKANIDAATQDEITALAILSIDDFIAEDLNGKLFLQTTLREIVALNKKIAEIDAILKSQPASAVALTRPTDDSVQIVTSTSPFINEQQSLIRLRKPKNISYKNHHYFSIAKKLGIALSVLIGLISASYLGLKLIAISPLFIAGLTALSVSLAVASGFYLVGLGIIHAIRIIFENIHNKQNLTNYNKAQKELIDKKVAAALIASAPAPAVILQETTTVDLVKSTTVELPVLVLTPPTRLEQAIDALDSMITVPIADPNELLVLYYQQREEIQNEFSAGAADIKAQINTAENEPGYRRKANAHLASIAIARRQAQATERAQAVPQQASDNIQALSAQPAAQQKTQQERMREQRLAAIAARGIK